jgi:hypothetical protein
MATNFLEYSGGTNGFLTAPVTLMTTELNALGSGAAATSSVAGPWTQATFSSGIILSGFMTGTTTITPTSGGNMSCWWLRSNDGGTTFESVVSTPSTTVAALGRSPDFIIPLYEGGAALGSTWLKWAMAEFIYPWVSTKLLVQNNSGVALAATGNVIKVGSVAIQY